MTHLDCFLLDTDLLLEGERRGEEEGERDGFLRGAAAAATAGGEGDLESAFFCR